jgi:hypothetical protein
MDRWPGIGTPRGQPLLSMIFLAETNVSLGNGPQHRLHEGLTLTKSTPTIIGNTTEAATGATGNSPQGARHQRLPHLQWWPLLDPPVATHRGLPSTSSLTSVVATVRHTRKRPQGGRNRRLPHHQWRPLPHPPVAPPGGPPSLSSSASVVATAAAISSNP